MVKDKRGANRAVQLLRETGITQAELGRQLNLSTVGVGAWFRGKSIPRSDTQQKCFELFGVPFAAWHEAAYGVKLPSEPVEEPLRGSVFALAKELQTKVRLLLDGLEDSAELTVGGRARVLHTCAQALAQSAKLTGDYELGARIVQLPVWREVVACFERSMVGFPEVAARFGAECRKMRLQERCGGVVS